MNDDLIDGFLEAWGSMGSLWGINRSVARVHGLLIITDRSWSLDDISRRLGISRGNASMSLKELRSWRVIRKIHRPGSRREFYGCEPDAWQMLFNIMRERKRREFDPLLASVRETLGAAERDPAGIDLERLRQMAQMLGVFERLAGRLLDSEEKARAVISLLEGKI